MAIEKKYLATKDLQEETNSLLEDTNAYISEVNEKVSPKELGDITVLTVDFLDASSLTITSGYLDTDAREIRTR